MAEPRTVSSIADPHDLARFVRAQESVYDQAMSEIRRGQKRSHWMWYIFPQFDGLGSSSTSRQYSIKSVAEAEAYLCHPVLGPRLLESVNAVLSVEGRSALDMFGSPDNLKLQSCATLFAGVSPPGSVFERLLDRYFGGECDDKTLRLAGMIRSISGAAGRHSMNLPQQTTGTNPLSDAELIRLLERFADAWNRRDLDALMSMMTDDCVFEASAGPQVDGQRSEGKPAVRAAYAAVFEVFHDAHWANPKHLIAGDRGVSEWTFTGTQQDGKLVEVTGCDLFTFRDGKIAIKNSYRKNRPAADRRS